MSPDPSIEKCLTHVRGGVCREHDYDFLFGVSDPRTLIPLRMRVRVSFRGVSRRVPVPLFLVSIKSFF